MPYDLGEEANGEREQLGREVVRGEEGGKDEQEKADKEGRKLRKCEVGMAGHEEGSNVKGDVSTLILELGETRKFKRNKIERLGNDVWG